MNNETEPGGAPAVPEGEPDQITAECRMGGCWVRRLSDTDFKNFTTWLDAGRPVVSGSVSSPPTDFSAVNLRRCVSPDGFNHPLESWSIAEWTNAIAGEAGEACNLAKKLIRFRDNVAGNKPGDRDQEDLKRRLADELADVVIYCDLAFAALGRDMMSTVREVFDRKSIEIGSPHVVAAFRPEERRNE